MAMKKVAINGLGRIGRAALKVVLETEGLELVAVNDLVPLDNIVYLLKYDTVYGRYGKEVRGKDGTLSVGKEHCRVLAEKDPAKLPWKELGVDVVLECTGLFTKKEDAAKHLAAGAKRVIISAPSKSPEVTTVVYGAVSAASSDPVISCASCTTNCITPVVEIMGRRVGIEKAVMTTIHAYTATQKIVDGPSKKMRRGRAGACNLVPTSTGAALATTRALPEFKNKFDGVAVRVPVPAGSLADLVFITKRPVTKEELAKIFTEEAQSDRYRGVLGVTRDPLVSTDILQDSRASIVDLDMTVVVDGTLVKIMSWYDNEWGYTCQMVREAARGR
jgi:glyceraldehyde 3-phosphate dehydrogenase